ncbi:MAG: 5'-nucleotidase C-terminal domain-containing protein [Flavobacterium sp.]
MFYRKISFIKKTQFVAFVTLLILFSCQSNYKIATIRTEKIAINDPIDNHKEIEQFIAPYRAHINKEMDSVLAFAPITLEKAKGKWQSNIGNMMADACLLYGNKVFQQRFQKEIDICLLNSGGIRNIIPQGNITTRTAFEVMPFENSLVVMELTGAQIKEMIQLFLADKKPHPLSGIQLEINADDQLLSAKINGQNIENEHYYFIATSDYLANGGDNMTFFLKAKNQFPLDYKIRNILIDYFKDNDTISAKTDERIIVR